MAFATSSATLVSRTATPVRHSGSCVAARAAPRSLVVRAAQGPKDAAMKAFGAIAAAQLALLPLTGAAVAMPTTWNTADLQKQVFFGFGEKKAEKVAAKAGDAADTAAKKADEATPDSFSIFDADSVKDARNKLKANIEEAVQAKSDPAEKVVSVGKPGESQEENAERIRREAENGPVEGGDARAPTN